MCKLSRMLTGRYWEVGMGVKEREQSKLVFSSDDGLDNSALNWDGHFKGKTSQYKDDVFSFRNVKGLVEISPH